MKYFRCDGRFSIVYKYHVRLLMHFTSVKPINLPHNLYRNLVKMAKKVQNRMDDHQASLYHHDLIKFIFLHQCTQKNISWETFMQSTVFMPSTSHPTSNSTPPTSSKVGEVVSSSKIPLKKTPSEEITQAYIRGKKLMFSPRRQERAKHTSVDKEASPHHHETSILKHVHKNGENH